MFQIFVSSHAINHLANLSMQYRPLVWHNNFILDKTRPKKHRSERANVFGCIFTRIFLATARIKANYPPLSAVLKYCDSAIDNNKRTAGGEVRRCNTIFREHSDGTFNLRFNLPISELHTRRQATVLRIKYPRYKFFTGRPLSPPFFSSKPRAAVSCLPSRSQKI